MKELGESRLAGVGLTSKSELIGVDIPGESRTHWCSLNLEFTKILFSQNLTGVGYILNHMKHSKLIRYIPAVI